MNSRAKRIPEWAIYQLGYRAPNEDITSSVVPFCGSGCLATATGLRCTSQLIHTSLQEVFRTWRSFRPPGSVTKKSGRKGYQVIILKPEELLGKGWAPPSASPEPRPNPFTSRPLSTQGRIWAVRDPFLGPQSFISFASRYITIRIESTGLTHCYLLLRTGLIPHYILSNELPAKG
jgi:hypothetical protein